MLNSRAVGIFFRYQIPCMNFFRPHHEYFLGLIGVNDFFSFNFRLGKYFFGTSLARPPPPDKFSNGPSLSEDDLWKLCVLPLDS